MISSGYNINICDESKKAVIIRRVFGVKRTSEEFREIYDSISAAKSEYPVKMTDVIVKYNNELKKYNLFDFDDILTVFIDEFSKIVLPNITHCLVDEFQDTNRQQLEILKVLQTRTSAKFVAVGDGDQCLYTWRGARYENINDFISHFKCEVLTLGVNFRCPTKVVNISKKIIEKNKNRISVNLVANKKYDGNVRVYRAPNELAEIDYCIAAVKFAIANKNSVIILYRNRTYKNHLELELKKNKIKYNVNDSTEICDRTALQAIIATLKVVAGSGDLYDFMASARLVYGLGSIAAVNIHDHVKETNELEQLLASKKKYMHLYSIYSKFKDVEASGGTLADMLPFLYSNATPSFTIADDIKLFVSDVFTDYKASNFGIKALANDLGLDNQKETTDSESLVELSTVHGFKGGEADVVLLLWAQQFEPKIGKEYNPEEERRLFYVAITRSKNDLKITYSGQVPKFVSEMK